MRNNPMESRRQGWKCQTHKWAEESRPPWVSMGQQAEYMEQGEKPCSGRGSPWEISPEDADLPMKSRYDYICLVTDFVLWKQMLFICGRFFWEDKLQLLSNQSQEEIKELPKIFHRQTAHPLYAGSLTGCELKFTFGIENIFNFHCFTIYARCKYCGDLVMKPVQWSRRLPRKRKKDCSRHLRSSLALNMRN